MSNVEGGNSGIGFCIGGVLAVEVVVVVVVVVLVVCVSVLFGLVVV